MINELEALICTRLKNGAILELSKEDAWMTWSKDDAWGECYLFQTCGCLFPELLGDLKQEFRNSKGKKNPKALIGP